MNMVEPIDEQLLPKLRLGDNQAWTLLYDSIAAELRAYIRRLGAKDPDNVLGETLAQMFRDISKFSGAAQELRPWSFRIAHNRVVDASRRQKSRPLETPLEPESISNITHPAQPDEIDLDRLSELLGQLTLEQREVVWLRHVAGFSLNETAEIVAKTPEATAAVTFRAMTALRKFLSAPS